MQTLDLSDSTARSENRLKSLFWPSIQSANDVDYLGAQGFWVCVIAGALALVFALVTGQIGGGVLLLLYYYLGGVGVRERSRYAAVLVLAMFVVDTIAAAFSIPRLIVLGLLLSNLRATWIAAGWKPGSQEAALPPRFSETFGDRFVDQWPTWLWPKVRIFYYIFAALFLTLVVLSLVMLRLRPHVG